MRKTALISLICVLALLLGCVGCGEKTEETAGSEAAQTGETLRVPPESFGGEKTQKPDGKTSETSAEGEKGEKPSDGEKTEKTADGEKKTETSAEGEKKADGTDKEASGEKTDSSGKKSKWPKGSGNWPKGGKRTRTKKGEDANAAEAPAEGERLAAPGEEPAPGAEAPAGEERKFPALEQEPPEVPERKDPTAAEGEIGVPNLEGAWEPRGSVGPRIEISGSRLIRLWNSSPVLVTEFKLRQDGERFVLELAENELKYTGESKPYATVKSCVYEDGAITVTDDFPITGESTETLRRTRNSRYGAVLDVSDSVLPGLAGRWEQEGGDFVLEFSGSHLSFGYGNHVEGGVNVIVVQNRRDKTTCIRDIDPAVENVGMFGEIRLDGDTLRTYIPITDAPAQEIVFRRAPTPTGGSTDYTDYNAAKKIKDTKIDDFSCTISLLSVYLPDETVLTSPRYEFSAKREDDGVTCVRRSVNGDETVRKDAAFLEKLQAIVARYDLAQFNGRDYVTHGLPDDFGATLKVTYSSGEKLYAADNQSMYLPIEAVRDLVQLFYAP